MRVSLATALIELSNGTHPDKIVDPIARSACVRVATVLRQRLHGDMWPRPWQIVGAAYADLAGDRMLCADDQGTGKTGLALLRVLLGGHRVTVIVTTASMFATWQKEIRAWLPGCPIHALDSEGSAPPAPTFRGIIVISWALLDAHVEALMDLTPSLVIADEAHYAGNPETTRSQAIADLVDASPHVLLLTGTPINNRAAELYYLLRLIDPAAWSDESEFDAMDPVDVAAVTGAVEKGDVAKAMAARIESEAVNARLKGAEPTDLQPVTVSDSFRRKLAQFCLRRQKRDTIPESELPPKDYRTIHVHLTPDQRAEYEFVERRFEEWLESALVARERLDLARGVRRTDTRSVEERVESAMRAEYLSKIGHLRGIVGKAKIAAAIEWIAGMIDQGEPVVVFGEHKAVLDGIAAGLQSRGIPFGQIVGKISKKQRGETVEAFQSGALNVVLASAAGKEGITLTRGRNVLFVQWFWTAAAADQGGDRTHRIGQTRRVTIWRMTCPDTIDVRLNTISDRKRRIMEGVIGNAPVRVVGVSTVGRAR